MNTYGYDFDFAAAEARLSKVIKKTPLIASDAYTEMTGNRIYLKPECLQVTGSFKIRGAYNKISKLSDEEKMRGLITASAGNHAQGVAYSARALGIEAHICMPEQTPLLKVNRTKKYGVDVILVGANFDEANAHSRKLEAENGYTPVHPFDDYDVMEGQGTIAYEILQELPDADTILVPCGGGGLISGICACAKAINPNIRIIGVESAEVPSMQNAVVSGQCCMLPWAKQTIADGTAVKQPGQKTYSFACRLVDRWIQVTDYELMQCFTEMIEQHKLIVEPSGLLSVAAAKKLEGRGEKIVCVMSGGNIDILTVANVINRGLVNKGRIFRFELNLSHHPGNLVRVLNILSDHRANIIKIDQDTYHSTSEIDAVDVTIAIETNGFEHIARIREALCGAGFAVKPVAVAE